jgi:hypothetical protein
MQPHWLGVSDADLVGQLLDPVGAYGDKPVEGGKQASSSAARRRRSQAALVGGRSSAAPKSGSTSQEEPGTGAVMGDAALWPVRGGREGLVPQFLHTDTEGLLDLRWSIPQEKRSPAHFRVPKPTAPGTALFHKLSSMRITGFAHATGWVSANLSGGFGNAVVSFGSASGAVAARRTCD